MIKRVLNALLVAALAAILCAVVYYRTSEPIAIEPSPSPVLELSPSPTPTPTPKPTPTPDPFADKPDINISSWEYTLVNKDNLLSSDFSPELTALENGQNFDSRAVEALKQFIAAARKEDLSVYITSSYRSYATQQSLFNNKVNQYISSEGSKEAATEKAKTIVAFPGTSEHQLGLACDIVDKHYEFMNETLESTDLSKWMAAHCAEYGFILRYPKDKTDITGVMFEPWHYRYVGTEAASYIMEKGLCFEEFIALYK